MFKKIIEKLNNAKSVGIFTHINPDGDAMGSAYSLKLVLERMGARADVFYSGEAEPVLLELVHSAEDVPSKSGNYDLLVALDCAASERLGKWEEYFLAHKNTVAIDHHITHISFAEEEVVCDISSTCELMRRLYGDMGAEVSVEAFENLYIGMATDTGNFKFSSVTGDTHRTVAELIDGGVDFATISKKLFDTVSKEYLALKTKAAEGIKYYLGDRVAVLRLSKEDFENSGISEAGASSLVTLPVSIEGVEVGVYIRPRTSEGYKVSLRSVKYVDVSAIATVFGGGGHIHAAAYSIDEDTAEESIEMLISEIEKRL